MSSTDNAVSSSRSSAIGQRNVAIAVALALTFAVAIWCSFDTPIHRALRLELFDNYQRWFPRERVNDSVVVIAIDELAIEKFGQWPWPRSVVAELVDKINNAGAAAIMLDIVFAESDQQSPSRLSRHLNAHARAVVGNLPDFDLTLADSIAGAPVVLGYIALEDDKKDARPRTAPVRQHGGNVAEFAPHYTGFLGSIEPIDAAARGRGILNAPVERGVVRQVPTVATIGDAIVPGAALETLRILAGNVPLQVHLQAQGIARVELAGISIPTTPDGHFLIHYSDHTERVQISAANILATTQADARLEGRIALIGLTAYGLLDSIATPLDYVPGLHVHAEAMDNVIDQRMLSRPSWLVWLEVASAILLSTIATAMVLRNTPLVASVAYVASSSLIFVAGIVLFNRGALLFDAINPLAATALCFVATLTFQLTVTQRHRRRLQRSLREVREAQARLAGELAAAARIQLGMLPQADDVFATDSRLEISASMRPARAVGGDLYDLIEVDKDHLFFLVGDVSGKGIAASLFMALAKALIHSNAIREKFDPAIALSNAAHELATDNREMLFLTALAGVLNLNSGELTYVNAGHELPWMLLSSGGAPTRLTGERGPPLCVLDDYQYQSEKITLTPGAVICIASDGATEAMNDAEEFYGSDRLESCLQASRRAVPTSELMAALEASISGFVVGAEQSDDQTLLIIRWCGGAAG